MKRLALVTAAALLVPLAASLPASAAVGYGKVTARPDAKFVESRCAANGDTVLRVFLDNRRVEHGSKFTERTQTGHGTEARADFLYAHKGTVVRFRVPAGETAQVTVLNGNRVLLNATRAAALCD